MFCIRIADSVSTIGSELSFYWLLFIWCQMCGWGLCVCGEEEEVLKMKLFEEDNAESWPHTSLILHYLLGFFWLFLCNTLDIWKCILITVWDKIKVIMILIDNRLFFFECYIWQMLGSKFLIRNRFSKRSQRNMLHISCADKEELE